MISNLTIYFIMILFLVKKKDEKRQKSASKARSAVSDAPSNLIKFISSIINEAGEHLIELNSHEPEVAVVNPQNHADFLHNLVFR